MLQSALLKPVHIVAKGSSQQSDWISPPRNDPEQKFRRLGSKHSGGNYIYRERKHSWWSGKQKTLPLRSQRQYVVGLASSQGALSAHAEAPRIRVRDREERVNNLWGELAALNTRLAGGDIVAARKRIDYLRS